MEHQANYLFFFHESLVDLKLSLLSTISTGAHSDVSLFFRESLVDSKLKRAVEQLRVIACGTDPVKAKSGPL